MLVSSIFLPSRVTLRDTGSTLDPAYSIFGVRWLDAAQQSPQPGEQLVERKRLRQIVIAAAVEARHAVVEARAGGQRQDRCCDPERSQLAHHLEPVLTRKHDVQHDRIVSLARAYSWPSSPVGAQSTV